MYGLGWNVLIKFTVILFAASFAICMAAIDFYFRHNGLFSSRVIPSPDTFPHQLSPCLDEEPQGRLLVKPIMQKRNKP